MTLDDASLIDALRRIAVEGHGSPIVRGPGHYSHPFHVRLAAEQAGIRLNGLLGPGSDVALADEAFKLLGLIDAEFQSDPMSVQCFDQRIVERVRAAVLAREGQ